MRASMAKHILSAAFVFSTSAAWSGPDAGDDEPGYSLTEIVKNNPGELANYESKLRLAVPVDIKNAFDNGSLTKQVSDTAPLLISEKAAQLQASEPTQSQSKNPKAYIASATRWTPTDKGAFVAMAGRLTIRDVGLTWSLLTSGDGK